MRRAVLCALLVASVLGGSLCAQRAGMTFHGNAVRSSGHPGFAGRRGASNRFFAGRSHFHRDGAGAVFAPYFLPYDEPVDYEQPETEAVTNGPAAPVVIPQTPAAPVPKAQVIEIPVVANSTAVKTLPPAIFILVNGERLETRRFLLTASTLSFSIGRQQSTIPLDRLDLDATIAANQERGIDLRIPADRNEISLSF
jgi:hypothetical protein